MADFFFGTTAITANNSTPKKDDFLTYLVDAGVIDHPAHQRIVAASTGSGQPIDTVVLELGLLAEDRLADNLARFLNLERIYEASFPRELATGLDVPLDFLRRTNVLPIDLNEGTVTLAVARPLDRSYAESIGYCLDRTPVLKISTASEISRHLSWIASEEQIQPDDKLVETGTLAGNDIERLRDVASEVPVIRLLNRLISKGVDQGASDIHIEPQETHLRIRYRIDGLLGVPDILDIGVQLGLVSRIKILSRLNIAEQRLPQDGRIRIAIKGREIDLRVSTAPTLHGESVVLRILDRKDVALDFESIGFGAEAVAKLKRIISVPNGVVIVTGPTGSGKTTTLYAALSLLNRPEVKIFTVEDPIEYNMGGVNQILVRPQIGLDFATVLRSVLRQDPDIIMIGEIRDTETAKIAVQASLTGHLVFTTLHTNSAAASVTRMRNIGIEDFLIASSVRAVISQRLVRKLCVHCRKSDTSAAAALGSSARRGKLQIYKAHHCEKCNNTGYKGRTVIYEILEFSEEIQRAVLAGKPDTYIASLHQEDGALDLRACGISKVLSGDTSRDELARVIADASP
jgi:general secretion pathway protein E